MTEGHLDIIIDEAEQFTTWKDSQLGLRNDTMPGLLKRISGKFYVKSRILYECVKEYTFGHISRGNAQEGIKVNSMDSHNRVCKTS
ncbi:MAG: hypothetical protein R3218_09965 [Christiangramia sp.]|nr:hypothetical protein [Christiangramia sp.]